MARNRKGRDISGWLIIDKPAGLTSTAVVNKVKWAMDAKKAGHAGTLDPAATGLLAVALGEATKTVPYITDATKCYTFEMVMGSATNTDDAEGEVIETSTTRPSDDDIKAALGQFVGNIEQVPPLFSAVKIDGVRAYKKARDGEAFEIKPRPLFVEELVMTDRRDADHVTLEMTCGKGGYVRAIARDLGRKLNCLGHVHWLRREWSGPFDLSHAIAFDMLNEQAKDPALDAHLLPLEIGLTDLPMVTCPAESITRFRNGNNAMVFPGDVEYGDECWVSNNGQAIAVGVYKSGEVHPSRVFVPAN